MNRASWMRSLAATSLVAALAVAVPAGAQDFTRYVALGDSLTAGFLSGGLLDQVQRNSYPALIARSAGLSSFQQPLVGSPGAPPLLDLRSLSPLQITPTGSQAGPPLNLNLARPYDNLAVPGFRVRDVLINPTNNGLVPLILRPPAFQNASALQQALLLQPTFVTLWIGNNDVLGAATSGIVIDGVTLTTVAKFESDFRAIVAAIRARGANLAIATVPNVTAIPFVTTIPPVVVNPATSQPVLVNGQPVPLIGPNGPLALTDRVLLPASGKLAQGIGIPAALGGRGTPLGTEDVLNGNELGTLNARVAAYNQIIRTVANEVGAALVDMNAIFDGIAQRGLQYAGISFSSAFLTGGLFSYDGVHPSPFGYAFAASEFIKAINGRFGSKLPPVDFAPFLYGAAGTAGTFSSVTGSATDFVFTKSANESLRRSLMVPTTELLLDIQRRRGGQGGGEAGGDPTGSNPGGGRPGGTERPNRGEQLAPVRQ